MSGHRRLAALNLIADATGEPVLARCEIVEDLDEADHFALQLIENDHEELAPEDWARGIRLLINKNPDWTAGQLAKSIGKPVSFARRHLRLLDLPEPVRRQLEDGDLTFTAADLLRKATKDGALTGQEAADRAQAIADGDLTTKQLRDEIIPPKDDTPDGPDLDDWGDEDDSTPPPADLAPYQPPVAPADRGADSDLDAAADALLEGTDDGGTLLPWENDPLSDTAPSTGRTPAWTQLDAYLLGRVLRDLASDDQLADLGVSRDGVFAYADGLGAGDRAAQLRRVGQRLLQDDPDAPDQYTDAANADI